MEKTTNLQNEDVDSELNRKSELAMSAEEVSQHVSLCLKLDAENKINAKNAFSLHLIQILCEKVTIGGTDLQLASLSLQASSKIYAGRVEALYKDTLAFNNQLQTVISNKKVIEQHAEDDGADNENDNKGCRDKKRKHKQSYVATETSLTDESEAHNVVPAMPHANFITIESAFTDSITAPSLLESLVLESDSIKYAVTESAMCINPLKPVPTGEFLYPDKGKSLIKKLQNKELNSPENQSKGSSNVFFEATENSPVAQEFDLNDDSFCIGTPPLVEEKVNDVDEIIEKLSVLDITADLFANDLSFAVIDGNTLDRRLLPPSSALKRVLNIADKSKVNKTPSTKVHKEKPPKEPFFNRQRVPDKSLLCKGRKTIMTAKNILEWKLTETTDLLTGSHDKFSTVFAENYEDSTSSMNETARKIADKLIQELTQSYSLKEYFLKKKQPWNLFEGKTNTYNLRPSSLGVCRRNENESSDPVNISETNSNGIIQSFQNLSFQNSHFGSDDDDPLPDSFSPEESIAVVTRRNSFYDDDLKSILVTPPESTKPIVVKYQTEPITLNTQKVKKAIWNVIDESEEVLLSVVHEKVKAVFVTEKVPLQYTFTMLLLLANEKCLCLENTSNGDLKITKDVREIEDLD